MNWYKPLIKRKTHKYATYAEIRVVELNDVILHYNLEIYNAVYKKCWNVFSKMKLKAWEILELSPGSYNPLQDYNIIFSTCLVKMLDELFIVCHDDSFYGDTNGLVTEFIGIIISY